MTVCPSAACARIALASTLTLALLAASFEVASAATFVINSLEDVGDTTPGDGLCETALVSTPCTLRAAVQEANALAGADTIQIPSFPITLVFTGTDDAALVGDLDVTDDVHIEGTGLTLLNAGTAERIFDVIAGHAVIDGLRTDGRFARVAVGASAMISNLEIERSVGSGFVIENSGRLVARDTVIDSGSTGIGLYNLGNSVLENISFSTNRGIFNAAGGVLVGRSLQMFPHVASLDVTSTTPSSRAIVNDGRMILSDSLIRDFVGFGAFDNVAPIRNAGQLTLTNVGIGPNFALGVDPFGPNSAPERCSGGLMNLDGAAAHLTQVTFHGNAVQGFCTSGAANDILNASGATVSVGSSVFAAGEPPLPSDWESCSGGVVSLGYNTAPSSSLCSFAATGDLVGDVSIAPFEFDEFPLPTSANALDNGNPNCPPRDALGHARPTGAGCDRGAIEVGAAIACQNGLDDDGDGLVDLLDPGCSSATDPLEVDLSPGDILLTSVEGGLLLSVDPVSGRREIIAGGGGIAGPAGVVRTADGSIYTASFGIAGNPSGPLMRVDPETGEQSLVAWDDSTLNNMTGMLELANGHLAVASPGSNQIAEVDPDTGLVTTLATGPTGFDPNGIALDPTTGRLFTTTPSGSDRLFEIVGGVAVPVTPASTGVGTPRDLVVAGEVAYISDSGATDQLLQVDLVTGTVSSVAPLKSQPRGVEIEADGSVLVADRTANEITRVNPDTGTQDIFATSPQIDDAYFMDVVASPEPCEWTRYADQARFEAALGGAAEVFDFSSVPLDGGGNAGFSNGHDFGPFTWTSLSLSADIDLFGTTAPDGTLYVTNTILPPEVQGWPGATGAAGTPANDDDFRLDFATGQQAAGIEILDSRVEAGERVEFRDDQDAVIAAFELPGKNAGAAGGDTAGFVGLEVCPGTPLIRSIVVNEGATVGTPMNDNIGFTNVVYVPEPGRLLGLGAGLLLLAGLGRRERKRAAA